MGSASKQGTVSDRPASSRRVTADTATRTKPGAPRAAQRLAAGGSGAVTGGLSRAQLLHLQRTAGNRAVVAAIQREGRRLRGDVNVTEDAPGVAIDVLSGTETTEGGTTHKAEHGGTFSVGGGNVLAGGGKWVRTDTTGTPAAGTTATTATTTGGFAVKPDASLDLTAKRGHEKVVTDASGTATTTGTSTSGGVNVGEKGVTLKGGRSRTTAGGSKHTTSGTLSVDWQGNVKAGVSHELETKGGTKLTPSISGGTTVEASDPIPAEGGGFDVTYTVTRSTELGLDASKALGGGPTVGVQYGTTEASLETGTRHFDDEKKARTFRDHAAAVVVREMFLRKPPTTVEGALQIPIGEERGAGEMSGSNIGGSVALEGATVGYGRSSSTTRRFSVRRIGAKVVQATGFVSGTKGSDWSISGGLSDTKGSSKTAGFEVTWEFDLGTRAGRFAFELYARTGLPPLVGATMRWVTRLGSGEDHDNVSIPLLGTARWTGTAWEIVRTDAKGTHEEFGGKKAHDQDPSWIGHKLLGQEKLRSSAQIVSSVERGKGRKVVEDYEARITVSGESGAYNREQLGKIFMDQPGAGAARPSGEWVLTAQVSPAVIHELERNNLAMRLARTREEKLRIYSNLVKERGAAMVGAQVGLGGDATAWSVELKGDSNFPGPAGRAKLDHERAALRDQLKHDPSSARSVAAEAQRTLDELAARRAAVADHKRYTDLPDGLRDEQLKLIDKHVNDFELVRHFAAEEAIKLNPGEKPEKARRRLASKHGYRNEQASAEGAEVARLRDQISTKEGAIKALDPKILEAITAVQQAHANMANLPFGSYQFALEHTATYNQHWNLGVDINDRQMAMAPRADALRMKLLEYLSPAEKKSTAEALLKQLTDRLTLLRVLYGEVRSAAEALKPITSQRAIARHQKFWDGIKGDVPPWAGGSPD